MTRPARRPSVFIVESDREIRGLLAVILQPLFDVTAFESGGDFLARAAALTTDVLIIGSPVYVDVGMRRRSVLDELVWRRSDHLLKRTIILTTRVSDRDLLGRASAARVFAVVGKPFDNAQLIDVVERCAAGRPESHSTLLIGAGAPKRPSS